MTENAEDWLSRKAASRYLAKIGCPISATQLARYACNGNSGGGPPFNRVGWNRVFYQRRDLDSWAGKHVTRIA